MSIPFNLLVFYLCELPGSFVVFWITWLVSLCDGIGEAPVISSHPKIQKLIKFLWLRVLPHIACKQDDRVTHHLDLYCLTKYISEGTSDIKYKHCWRQSGVCGSLWSRRHNARQIIDRCYSFKGPGTRVLFHLSRSTTLAVCGPSIRSLTGHELALRLVRLFSKSCTFSCSNGICNSRYFSYNGYRKLHHVDIPYVPSLWSWISDHLEVHTCVCPMVRFWKLVGYKDFCPLHPKHHYLIRQPYRV